MCLCVCVITKDKKRMRRRRRRRYTAVMHIAILEWWTQEKNKPMKQIYIPRERERKKEGEQGKHEAWDHCANNEKEANNNNNLD